MKTANPKWPTWIVTGELNWDASRHGTVRVKANTERKARIYGEKRLKAEYKTNLVKIEKVVREEQL